MIRIATTSKNISAFRQAAEDTREHNERLAHMFDRVADKLERNMERKLKRLIEPKP